MLRGGGPRDGGWLEEVAMAEYQFERDARTPFSEAYVIEQDGEAMGRVDLHFTPSGVVQGTLCVPAHFDDDDIQDLIGEVDERLVLSADADRVDFVVTVWRGAAAGVYSEDEELEEEDEGDDEEPGGNGRFGG
jgi:hypothetical protein